MDISEVLIVPTTVTTILIQLIKQTPKLKALEEYIAWVALLVGCLVYTLWQWQVGGSIVVSEIIWNGLMVGLASIGAYKVGNTIPVMNKVVK